MTRSLVRLLKRKKTVMAVCRIDAKRKALYVRAARAEYAGGDRKGSRSLSLWMRKHLDKVVGYVEE